MTPKAFPQQNRIYKKPEGWEDDQCGDLPTWAGEVAVDDRGTKVPAIISCWQLSKEEVEEIQRTGEVWLSVTGTTLPPVAVFTQNPFPNAPVS